MFFIVKQLNGALKSVDSENIDVVPYPLLQTDKTSSLNENGNFKQGGQY